MEQLVDLKNNEEKICTIVDALSKTISRFHLKVTYKDGEIFTEKKQGDDKDENVDD